jgi:3-oxoacyl-[acyl-carrier-protein] synthase III
MTAAADTMIGSRKVYPPGRPLRFRRHARIVSTGAGMPDETVTNRDLIDELDLIASDRAVQYSIGIKERRRAPFSAAPSFYLEKAARECIDRSGVDPEKIDRIIYAKLFGDRLVPATALNVLERLGLRRGIPAMDIAAACSGVMHAMDLALSFINAGEDYVLVLGGDRTVLCRDSAVPRDTRTVFLNGDGFAAVLLGPSSAPVFHAKYFYTDSDLLDFAYIPFGTELLNKTHRFGPEMFAMTMPDGKRIHRSVIDSCRIISSRLFRLAGKTISDIDYFITSDQTRLVWQDQLKLLGLTEDKSTSCFHKYGNTVAAMVPLNLHEAVTSGVLRRGMTVMMMGHGAGASGGGFIFTF